MQLDNTKLTPHNIGGLRPKDEPHNFHSKESEGQLFWGESPEDGTEIFVNGNVKITWCNPEGHGENLKIHATGHCEILGVLGKGSTVIAQSISGKGVIENNAILTSTDGSITGLKAGNRCRFNATNGSVFLPKVGDDCSIKADKDIAVKEAGKNLTATCRGTNHNQAESAAPTPKPGTAQNIGGGILHDRANYRYIIPKKLIRDSTLLGIVETAKQTGTGAEVNTGIIKVAGKDVSVLYVKYFNDRHAVRAYLEKELGVYAETLKGNSQIL